MKDNSYLKIGFQKSVVVKADGSLYVFCLLFLAKALVWDSGETAKFVPDLLCHLNKYCDLFSFSKKL